MIEPIRSGSSCDSFGRRCGLARLSFARPDLLHGRRVPTASDAVVTTRNTGQRFLEHSRKHQQGSAQRRTTSQSTGRNNRATKVARDFYSLVVIAVAKACATHDTNLGGRALQDQVFRERIAVAQFKIARHPIEGQALTGEVGEVEGKPSLERAQAHQPQSATTGTRLKSHHLPVLCLHADATTQLCQKLGIRTTRPVHVDSRCATPRRNGWCQSECRQRFCHVTALHL
jgi:hypothetical protein